VLLILLPFIVGVIRGERNILFMEGGEDKYRNLVIIHQLLAKLNLSTGQIGKVNQFRLKVGIGWLGCNLAGFFVLNRCNFVGR